MKDIFKLQKDTDPDTLSVFVATSLCRLPSVTFDNVDMSDSFEQCEC